MTSRMTHRHARGRIFERGCLAWPTQQLSKSRLPWFPAAPHQVLKSSPGPFQPCVSPPTFHFAISTSNYTGTPRHHHPDCACLSLPHNLPRRILFYWLLNTFKISQHRRARTGLPRVRYTEREKFLTNSKSYQTSCPPISPGSKTRKPT